MGIGGVDTVSMGAHIVDFAGKFHARRISRLPLSLSP
jgi:hypothetical protein